MHKLYTSSFDASIYLQQPDQNSGRDEILEISKLYYGNNKDIARTFIKFEIPNMVWPSAWKAYLNLKSANSEEIPLEYTIYANAVSQSWTMGTGTKFDNITSDGISWKYRNGIDSWQDNTIGGSATYITGTTGSANAEGGTWYTVGESTQSFNNELDDIRIDISSIMNQWISGSIPNNGLILRHSFVNEENTLDYGSLKFFSKETNTIYEPKLEIVWDDSSFVVGGLQPVTGSLYDGDYKIIVNNLKNEYFKDTKIRVRIKGRESYPAKSFTTTFAYEQIKTLPSGSTYYQLEDYITGEIVFPFGEYTKVSCDSTSNYFDMDLNSLSASRVYKLKLKIEEDGISTIVDDKLVFEIIE